MFYLFYHPFIAPQQVPKFPSTLNSEETICNKIESQE